MTLQTACTGKTAPEERTPEKANTLASATEIINSRCPEMVDVESRLDSVILSDEGHLAYYYTLLERDKININPAAFKAYLLPGAVSSLMVGEKSGKLPGRDMPSITTGGVLPS